VLRATASAEAARQKQLTEAAEQAEIEAQAARQTALAAMSPNLRRIEEFKNACTKRCEQLLGKKDAQNTKLHGDARKLSGDARESAGWSAEEKLALADAIEEWLPKVVQGIDKDQLKKLKLAALRAP